MSQLALPLAYLQSHGAADFFVSEANRDAVRQLAEPRRWPVPVTLLIGPAQSGKSHLAGIFAQRTGGAVIDDALDTMADEALFHAWNAASHARPLLVVARTDLRDGTRLPDLASRLAATPRAAIHPPDDALLAAIMRKRFRDLGLEVGPDVVAFVLARIERSFAAVADAVARLDIAALAAARAVTIPLARDTLFGQLDWLTD